MLIADRAALLLLDAEGKRWLSGGATAAVLAGALLDELVLLGRLVVDPGTATLRVLPGGDLEPRLAVAAAAVEESSGHVGRSLRAVARAPLWADAVAALSGTGAVRVERRRRFLLFTSVRRPPSRDVLGPLQESVRDAVALARRRRGMDSADPATVSLVVLIAGAGGVGWLVTGLRTGPSAVEIGDRLAGARTLPPDALEALQGIESAVSARVHALATGDSSFDAGGGGSDDGGHHGGHHGGSDGGSDGGGGDGGGGGGGD